MTILGVQNVFTLFVKHVILEHYMSEKCIKFQSTALRFYKLLTTEFQSERSDIRQLQYLQTPGRFGLQYFVKFIIIIIIIIGLEGAWLCLLLLLLDQWDWEKIVFAYYYYHYC
jgi:hypothetical protein